MPRKPLPTGTCSYCRQIIRTTRKDFLVEHQRVNSGGFSVHCQGSGTTPIEVMEKLRRGR
jgi:hypothetical protein